MTVSVASLLRDAWMLAVDAAPKPMKRAASWSWNHVRAPLGRGLIWAVDHMDGREWSRRRPRCVPGELLSRIWYVDEDIFEDWHEEGTALFMGSEPYPGDPVWRVYITWSPQGGRQKWDEWDFYRNFRRHPDADPEAPNLPGL